MSCKEEVRVLIYPIQFVHFPRYRALIAGGGAPEIHVSRLLSQHAQSLKGMEAYCFQAYADAQENGQWSEIVGNSLIATRALSKASGVPRFC
jgi:hypothetical protein